MNTYEKTILDDINKYFKGIEHIWEFYKRECEEKRDGLVVETYGISAKEVTLGRGGWYHKDNSWVIEWGEKSDDDILEIFITRIKFQRWSVPNFNFYYDHHDLIKDILKGNKFEIIDEDEIKQINVRRKK